MVLSNSVSSSIFAHGIVTSDLNLDQASKPPAMIMHDRHIVSLLQARDTSHGQRYVDPGHKSNFFPKIGLMPSISVEDISGNGFIVFQVYCYHLRVDTLFCISSSEPILVGLFWGHLPLPVYESARSTDLMWL